MYVSIIMHFGKDILILLNVYNMYFRLNTPFSNSFGECVLKSIYCSLGSTMAKLLRKRSIESKIRMKELNSKTGSFFE